MIIILAFQDQNLILKFYIINNDRQNFNHSTNFLIYLIFPTLTLFATLLRHFLTNQNSLCISINYKPSSETLEPNMIHDQYREQIFVFSSHHHLLPVNNHFHLSWTEKNYLSGLNQFEWSWSSKTYGNIHCNLFLVHHSLYLLHFAFKTLLFQQSKGFFLKLNLITLKELPL